MASSNPRPDSASGSPVPLPVDHLVWGGRHLEEEIDRLEGLTGVRAMLGGRHPGEGTHNALLRLGPRAYLELIAPDPSRKRSRPPWFGLDTLTSARLVGWAVKSTDLIRRAAAARSERVPVGEVRSGRREDSSGHVLSWRLTYPASREEAGIVPFLIDWGDSPHPADAAPQGLALIDLRAEHPDPASVIQHLRHLGLELRVLPGPRPALIATVDTPRGLVELR